MLNRILLNQSDARRLPFADCSVQCIVTSPPYFRLRNYGIADQIGLEETVSEYVAAMERAGAEMWRVLRDDGVLWLNIGDTYNGSGGAGGDYRAGGLREGQTQPPRTIDHTLKKKDMIGIPWRIAFAFQASGWYLRDEIIWSKPSTMPQSATDRTTRSHEQIFLFSKMAKYYFDHIAIQEPSVTNEKRAGGLVRNREKEYNSKETRLQETRPKSAGFKRGSKRPGKPGEPDQHREERKESDYDTATRNKRSVWTISPRGFPGAHFATFPPELPKICILAGTSERGACPECGAPWERIVEKTGETSRSWNDHTEDLIKGAGGEVDGKPSGSIIREGYSELRTTTIGWSPTCDCYGVERLPKLKRIIQGIDTVTRVRAESENAQIRQRRAELLESYQELPTVPCVVADPFGGAGTTAIVAGQIGRIGVSSELSFEYLKLTQTRTQAKDLNEWINGKPDQGSDLSDLPMFQNLENGTAKE